jgi:ATPase subunit of ABC transporter with duplicated ATPase domains
VEVGGRIVVADASFTVMPRDTVGLVGRNGAGKTSLLRVLGKVVPPTGGSVHVTGGLGYLPQDPRIAGHLDGRTAVEHVLSGRGMDQAAVELEKLRLQLEEDPSDRNVRRYSRAQEQYEAAGGYAADSEVRSIAAGLGLLADRLDLPLAVLSGGERRRVELARILYAGSDVLLLDEPTNHLDADAKAWLLKFLRQYRGALVVISHDLDLLDEAITRVLHLDRAGEEDLGHLVEYRGTYSQYLANRARDEERQAKVAAAQAKEIDRLQTPGGPVRGQGEQGQLRPQPREAHRPHRGHQGGCTEGRQAPERPVPRSTPLRARRARRGRSRQGLRRPAGVLRRQLRRRPGRAVPRARPERRRQDEPAAHPRRRVHPGRR